MLLYRGRVATTIFYQKREVESLKINKAKIIIIGKKKIPTEGKGRSETPASPLNPSIDSHIKKKLRRNTSG